MIPITKMPLKIAIEHARTVQGVRHPDNAEDVKLESGTLLSLEFPGTPEEVGPIMQDLITQRADALIAQALQQMKQKLSDATAAVDTKEDKRLHDEAEKAAKPPAVETAPAQ